MIVECRKMKGSVPVIFLFIHDPWPRELGEKDTHCTAQENKSLYFYLRVQHKFVQICVMAITAFAEFGSSKVKEDTFI